MHGKPLEYWLALIGMVLYAAARDAEKEALWRRVAKIAAAALLSMGLSPSLAPMLPLVGDLEYAEIYAAIGIMAFGLIVLDTATALVADREFIKDLLRRRIGGGDK